MADSPKAPIVPAKVVLDNIRQGTVNLLKSKIDYLTEQQLLDTEASIYDSAVMYSHKHGCSSNLNNKVFRHVYQGLIRHWLVNLDPTSYIGNKELSDRIKSGELPIARVIGLAPRETMPSRWVDYEARVSAEIRVITQGELVATTTLFVCGKCKNNICSYYQLQSRSIDEGVTNYITCNNCGHFWKQHN